MSTFIEAIENITPEIYENLKRAVELGKWGDGRKLSAEQKETCMQAMIAWELRNLPEEERTGYLGGQECASQTKAKAAIDTSLFTPASGNPPLMIELGRGRLAKMRVQLGESAQYELPLDDAGVPLNPLIGQRLRLEYLGAIHCTHCGRRTNKSFSQGYCYPCFKKLPQCDLCIVSPEKCHHALGTCRDPQWGEDFCMTDHVVYLANSSGIKVGITRATQLPTRWLDQGASQALPILRVATRQQSGLVEDLLRSQVADRTNWRALLKGDAEPLDLPAVRENLFEQCSEGILALQQRFGLQAIQPLPTAEVLEIRYPVEAYPTKITSLDLEKTPVIEGVLRGIKGQYLILDCGVINIRKYTAYQLAISSESQQAAS